MIVITLTRLLDKYYVIIKLFFTVVIHFVILSSFILALFHIVAVTVNDDLDFAVMTDDMFVYRNVAVLKFKN